MAEKVPGWVERLLILTLETQVRTIMEVAVAHPERAINTGFEAMDAKSQGIDAKFGGVGAKLACLGARIDSFEKRIPMLQDIADLEALIAALEKRTAERAAAGPEFGGWGVSSPRHLPCVASNCQIDAHRGLSPALKWSDREAEGDG